MRCLAVAAQELHVGCEISCDRKRIDRLTLLRYDQCTRDVNSEGEEPVKNIKFAVLACGVLGLIGCFLPMVSAEGIAF